MLTHEEKQIHNAVHAELREFEEFKVLVKRMREAQEELDTCSIGDYAFRQYCAAKIESEVDEYLKKMEGIDKRKALEAENTEFEYGHNVKHYNED